MPSFLNFPTSNWRVLCGLETDEELERAERENVQQSQITRSKHHTIIIGFKGEGPKPLTAVPNDVDETMDLVDPPNQTEPRRNEGDLILFSDASDHSERLKKHPGVTIHSLSLGTMKNEVQSTISKLQPQDQVNIFYFGHMSESNDDYFIELDDGSIVHGEMLIEWIVKSLKVDALVVLIFDTCHSNGYIEFPFVYEFNESGEVECLHDEGNTLGRNARGRIVFLGASAHDQVAKSFADDEGYARGYFSFELFDYLEDRDGSDDPRRILSYLRRTSLKHRPVDGQMAQLSSNRPLEPNVQKIRFF